MIIDVDTHWESTNAGDDDAPLAPWRDQLPRSLDLLAFAIAGDLVRALPEADRVARMDEIGIDHCLVNPASPRR